MHEAGEFERLLRRHHIAVHDVQRIAGLPHVQPRQRAPGAADRVEGAPLAVLRAGGRPRAPSATIFSAFLSDFDEMSCSARPPSGSVTPGFDPLAVDVGQFERAAAEIADDAVGLVEARHHPERRQFRLALAREDVDLDRRRCARPRRRRPCRSSRRGRRRSRSPTAGATSMPVAQGAKAPQRRERLARSRRRRADRWSAPRVRAPRAPFR